ncbi:MAG: PAS domain S-box protein [Mangrovibacterium sp.]
MNNITKPNILLVDDNPIDLMLLEVILNKEEVNTIKANSAGEALKKIEGIELALAIVDVQMPQMNGIELARLIMKDKKRQVVPIIFITAYYSDDFQFIEGYGAGAVDYLLKPVNKTILSSKIKVFLDLDKQKRLLAENKKRFEESKEWLQAIYESIPGGIMIVGNDYIIEDVNDVTCRITGYRKEELVGQLCDKICPKGSASDECPVWVHQHHEFKGMDTFIKCRDGRNIPILKNAKKIHYNGALYIMEIFQDISSLKSAEEALVKSENMYRTLLDASPEGILILDLSGHITEVSGIALEIFGTENKQDLIGRHFLRFIHRDSVRKVRNVIEKTISEGLEQDTEFILTKIDHKQFIGEVSTTLIQESNGMLRSFMAIIRDISQRKEIEKQMIHTERMAGLGEMATGIAHEINQPLNTISMSLDNMLLEISKTENEKNGYLVGKINKIFENIYRISKIIDHIRAFSRGQDDYISTAFDINESIKNALSMILVQCMHRGIDLITDFGMNLPLILGNTYRFEQVILNLIINAKDAVEEKEKYLSFNKEIRLRTFLADHNLCIEIEDNGEGIKKEDIGNVMLPFYSTKEVGKGTGMGLAISFGIIKEMKGKIAIRSEVLKGTSIRISLPVNSAPEKKGEGGSKL